MTAEGLSPAPALDGGGGSEDETWTCTRAQLIDALANIEVRGVQTSGPMAGKVIADDMADAILEQLTPDRMPEGPIGNPHPIRSSTGAEWTLVGYDESGFACLDEECPRCSSRALISNEFGSAECAACGWREAVIVSREDLVTVLAAMDPWVEAEPLESAFKRLSAAAGVE